MESTMTCDYCKQKTDTLYALFKMMVCKKCHSRLISSFQYGIRA